MTGRIMRERFSRSLAAAFLAAGIVCTLGAQADEKAAAGEQSAGKTKNPMRMDQPMSGEMKRETMVKGDVKKAAEKKQQEMKDAMDKEEKAMSMGEAKK
jgi:hypothetical protein